jgi:zona occludens toxin (predicted ATPase)
MTENQAKRAMRSELATRAFILALLAVFALTSWGVYLIRNQQVQNATTLESAQSAARDAAQTARVIESCTTPGRACFNRSQRRTADAVANINQVVIIAAACAGQHPGKSVAEIQNCVINRLADHKH